MLQKLKEYNKQIFVRDLNILSLFKYMGKECISFFHKIVFIIPEMFVLTLIKYSQPYTKILIHKEIHVVLAL